MQTIDYIVFFTYFILVSAYGIWIYKRKQRTEASTTDFFLAEGSLTWWAIGASLIASNISAEQFVGMSGEGFNVGIAIACYEWIAALALIIVAVFFMPVYLKNHIFTMPQFLKTRYNETTATIMTIFWLFLYVFVNLTSILYLGAKAIVPLVGNFSFAGLDSFQWTIILMSLFAVFITIGGMKVIGYTDVIQVLVLILGGLATTYLALQLVSQAYGGDGGAWDGWRQLLANHSDHFHMVFDKPARGVTEPSREIDKYLLLPGIAMYFAGQWIINLNYWGCNQYITQRALGADLQTARTGILFAGFLKLMMPIIVMLPGIAAFALNSKGMLNVESKDSAYASILLQLQPGLKGLAAAALTAAIVASLAGKLNSISTIFTLDIWKKFVNPKASEANLVWIGRLVIWTSIALAIALTWKDVLKIGGKGGFTFIQIYTGYVSPGIFAMFLLGMFWKRTTGAAALTGLLMSVLLSIFFDNFATTWWGTNTFLYDSFPTLNDNKEVVYKIPFQIWMGLNFVITSLVMIAISLLGPKINPKAFNIDSSMFKLQPITIVQITATFMILSALYVKFW